MCLDPHAFRTPAYTDRVLQRAGSQVLGQGVVPRARVDESLLCFFSCFDIFGVVALVGVHIGILGVDFISRVPPEVPVVEIWVVLVEVKTVGVSNLGLLFRVVSLF
jgi:hypothetical protein